MHGIVNRSIQEFVRSCYGERAWRELCAAAGIDPRGFHLGLDYARDFSLRLLELAGSLRGKTVLDVAEDLGAWLAIQPALCRLLRFGGSSFIEFVLSLSELPGRLRMAVAGLELPAITVTEQAGGFFVSAPGADRVWEHALAGVLQAMADVYGALALISFGEEGLEVVVPLAEFAEARPFSLAPAV